MAHRIVTDADDATVVLASLDDVPLLDGGMSHPANRFRLLLAAAMVVHEEVKRGWVAVRPQRGVMDPGPHVVDSFNAELDVLLASVHESSRQMTMEYVRVETDDLRRPVEAPDGA